MRRLEAEKCRWIAYFMAALALKLAAREYSCRAPPVNTGYHNSSHAEILYVVGKAVSGQT